MLFTAQPALPCTTVCSLVGLLTPNLHLHPLAKPPDVCKPSKNLRELIPQKSAADLALLLQPWGYQFRKLLLDPAKAVRSEAAGIMAAVGAAVGKGLLPQLKTLLGPWYLACFDPYPDAAAAAKRSLVEVFPGRKQADALLYCRSGLQACLAVCCVCR